MSIPLVFLDAAEEPWIKLVAARVAGPEDVNKQASYHEKLGSYVRNVMIYYVNVTPKRHRENLSEVDPKQSESAPRLWREPQQASPPCPEATSTSATLRLNKQT